MVRLVTTVSGVLPCWIRAISSSPSSWVRVATERGGTSPKDWKPTGQGRSRPTPSLTTSSSRAPACTAAAAWSSAETVSLRRTTATLPRARSPV